MVKVKSSFFCQECGVESPKWVGKCPSCGQWNTYVEEKVATGGNHKRSRSQSGATEAVELNEYVAEHTERLLTSDAEFNRVLGGGMMAGSVTLVGGEPGIGKSTLLLQIAARYQNEKVLYVSGE